MTTINAQQLSMAYALREKPKVIVDVTDDGGDTPETVQSNRTDGDTVELSNDGQKAVNLNRGTQLAQEIKDAPIDENFADTLEQATDDVFRVSEIFRQTMRATYGWWK